jgi:hypothetical protein
MADESDVDAERWETVGVSALTPEMSMDAMSAMQQWEVEALEGRPPVALLHQRRRQETRVVYGKTTLVGTVIPVGDDSEPPRAGPWTTTDVEALTPGISAGAADVVGLLVQTNGAGETRVRLASGSPGHHLHAFDDYPKQFINFRGPWEEPGRKARFKP